MLASTNRAQPFHYVLLVSWLGLVMVAAGYFISARLVAFDPQNKLLNIEHPSIVAQVQSMAELEGQDLSNTIIHFTSKGCYCSQFSADHKLQIDTKASADNFKVINIELTSNSQLTFIPSTPAILMIDKTSELMYLGPYSKGLSCSQSNGYVEMVMDNYSQGFNTKLVFSDAQGCYCKI